MEHKGTVTLETPRLILRRLTLADAEPMYRNWASATLGSQSSSHGPRTAA